MKGYDSPLFNQPSYFTGNLEQKKEVSVYLEPVTGKWMRVHLVSCKDLPELSWIQKVWELLIYYLFALQKNCLMSIIVVQDMTYIAWSEAWINRMQKTDLNGMYSQAFSETGGGMMRGPIMPSMPVSGLLPWWTSSRKLLVGTTIAFIL